MTDCARKHFLLAEARLYDKFALWPYEGYVKWVLGAQRRAYLDAAVKGAKFAV